MEAFKPWWELRLSAPQNLADDLSAMLISEGALGVSEDHDFEVDGNAGNELTTAATPDSAPDLELDPERPMETDTLIVSFDGSWSQQAVLHAANQAFEILGLAFDAASASVRYRDDTDWGERWKDYYEPMAFGEDLWVVPAWQRDFRPPQRDAYVLRVDPGMAFGTGQHATTALCLDMLVDARRRGAVSGFVLDVGAGSGILSLATLLLGAEQAVATDIDPDALRAAESNAELNNLDERLVVCDTPLQGIGGQFNWVVANIVTPVLVELAEQLVGHMQDGGHLLLSGILAHQREQVLDAFHAATEARGRPVLEEHESASRGDWVALWLRFMAGGGEHQRKSVT